MEESENIVPITEFVAPRHDSYTLENDIHVWRLPVKTREFSLLNPSEKEFAAKFHFEEDRNRFSTGREGLRLLASKYLSVHPASIQIVGEPGEKPRIVDPAFPLSSISPSSFALRYNISHSGDWVLIAFANDEVGIDVEKLNPDFDFEGLLPEHFSEVEQLFISQVEDQLSAFFFLWTRKEALTKAWGTGLQENLKMVSALDEWAEVPSNEKSWKIESFNISEEYPAALAYTGASDGIKYFDGENIFF